jgi:hypothetical protein
VIKAHVVQVKVVQVKVAQVWSRQEGVVEAGGCGRGKKGTK